MSSPGSLTSTSSSASYVMIDSIISGNIYVIVSKITNFIVPGVCSLIVFIITAYNCALAWHRRLTRGKRGQRCVEGALGGEGLHLVHRLDLWTTGVLLLARSLPSATAFMADLASPDRPVLKEYKALLSRPSCAPNSMYPFDDVESPIMKTPYDLKRC